MILDLDKVSETARLAADEVVRVREPSGEETPVDCHIDVTVRRVGESFYLDAKLRGTYVTACHRCLEPANVDVSSAFTLVVHRETRATESEMDWDDEDYVRVPRGESELSLDQFIHEQVVVNIPIQVYCKEDCKGLCPQCGVNLNTESCTCADTTDSRWDALRRLGDKQQG